MSLLPISSGSHPSLHDGDVEVVIHDLRGGGRPCPLCGSRTAERLADVRLTQLDQSFLPGAYVLAGCAQCDVAFADSPATQQDYDAHYRSMSIYSGPTSTSAGQNAGDVQRLHEMALRVVSLVDRPSGSAVRVLDLGCGAGGLLDSLRSLGHPDCVGLDPNGAAVQAGVGRGLDIRQGFLSDAEDVFAGEEFDVVVMSHVLEHVRDLDWFGDLAGLLSAEGVIYAEVPDAQRYDVGVRPPGYFYDSEHINHFGPTSLAGLAHRFDLAVTDIHTIDLPLADGTTYPAMGAVFVPGGRAVVDPVPRPADALLDRLKGYLHRSAEAGRTSLTLDPPLPVGAPFLVWGVGSFTQRLLGDGVLPTEGIVAFVDGAPSRQGRTVLGLPVVGPAAVRETYPDLPIVVSIAIGGAQAAADIAAQTGAPVHCFTW